MVNKNTSFRHIYMCYSFIYCVSLDVVDIVKFGTCEPMSVGLQQAGTESPSLDLQYLMKY